MKKRKKRLSAADREVSGVTVRHELGWSIERAADTLAELVRAGVIEQTEAPS